VLGDAIQRFQEKRYTPNKEMASRQKLKYSNYVKRERICNRYSEKKLRKADGNTLCAIAEKTKTKLKQIQEKSTTQST